MRQLGVALHGISLRQPHHHNRLCLQIWVQPPAGWQTVPHWDGGAEVEVAMVTWPWLDEVAAESCYHQEGPSSFVDISIPFQHWLNFTCSQIWNDDLKKQTTFPRNLKKCCSKIDLFISHPHRDLIPRVCYGSSSTAADYSFWEMVTDIRSGEACRSRCSIIYIHEHYELSIPTENSGNFSPNTSWGCQVGEGPTQILTKYKKNQECSPGFPAEEDGLRWANRLLKKLLFHYFCSP